MASRRGKSPPTDTTPPPIPLHVSTMTWNKDTFLKYIDNPAGMVPGTRMAFGGIKDPTEVANLWAYVNEYKADGTKK